MGKPEGKRPLDRPRRKFEDNIKMDLQEVGSGTWTGLIWFRIGTGGKICKCGNEHSDSIKCGEFLEELKTDQLVKKDSAAWRK